MSRLAGKRAVITGAGRGLGLAVAELFVSEGAAVVLADLDEGAITAAANRLEAAGGTAIGVRADIAAAADVQALMAAAVERLGGLDVLVNNAGIVSAGSVTEVDEAHWNRVLRVNLTGAYLCSRYAIPHLERAGGGSIVCVSSSSGVVGKRDQVAYNVSKHGLVGLVRCMALDHADAGIRVNAVCPGAMDTPALQELSSEQRAELAARNPLGRVADPAEVAQTVLHLASDESSFTTGALFLVDGGLTAMLRTYRERTSGKNENSAARPRCR
ncbi:MAG: SDR family oxidoreductase [Spirochaetaceae bacterium]|nr:SDR family oxidoreductase [Spirochaetaceae bacterium]